MTLPADPFRPLDTVVSAEGAETALCDAHTLDTTHVALQGGDTLSRFGPKFFAPAVNW